MGRVVHIQLNCCNHSLISSFEAPPPNLLPLSHSSAFILSSSVGSDRVILSGGVLFSALGIYNGEKFFPGYTISIDEVKVNGEVRELSGKEYTCSDDGNCTRVLCPQFNVFPSVSFESDLKKIVFHRLLEEQSGILNFLSEQKTAVINGAAGTGKTMIAVEKAQRHATVGEKVLFLCYNVQLKNYLSENYAHDNIDYYTISGLACKLCNTTTPNYEKMKSVLEDMYVFDNFPYMHVVIDEGQDFGIEAVQETGIIEVLKSIITDIKPDNASFYIFYDKLQLVQSRKIPQYISDADCKLTLYRNCRNTENIATTSLAPITERKPKLIDGCVKGVPAKLHFCESDEKAREKLDLIIDTLKGQGIKDIVILTCKTESASVLGGFVSNGVYRDKYRFSTCRKFKGLEADAVILVDVTSEIFEEENSLIYYVGTSRARLWLDIITTMDNEACTDVLQSVFEKRGHIKNPQRELAAAINAIPSK